MIYFSETEKGFFIEGLHDVIPEDGVVVTPEQHATLLDEQSTGKVITVVNGEVVTVERELNATWQGIRQRRNRLITLTDWTQLGDAPLDEDEKAAWQAYRQTLRDITDSVEDPNDVVWPTKPS